MEKMIYDILIVIMLIVSVLTIVSIFMQPSKQDGAADAQRPAGDGQRFRAGDAGGGSGAERGHADPGGLCDRDRAAQRLRHRAEPAARGGGGDHRADAPVEPRGGGGRHRP